MKRVEISPMYGGISTSVLQIYNISKRNANQLTLVNTVFIPHFSSFFSVSAANGMFRLFIL